MPRPDQDSRLPDRQARAGSGHLGITKWRTRICAIDAAVGSAWHARDTERPFVRAQFKRQRDRCIRTDRRLGVRSPASLNVILPTDAACVRPPTHCGVTALKVAKK